jgi:hypothetical protein
LAWETLSGKHVPIPRAAICMGKWGASQRYYINDV